MKDVVPLSTIMITHRIRKMIVYIWIYYEMREEQSFRNPRSINVKIKLAQSSQLWIHNGYIMDMDMDMDMDISLPG